MFSLEFSSGRPLGSAPYYSLVIREPYIVGRSRGSDILLDDDDIAQQHASLTVVRRSQIEVQSRTGPEECREGDADKAEDEGGVVGSFLDDAHDMTNGHVASWSPSDVPCMAKKVVPASSRLQENDPLMLLVVNLHGGGRVLANGTEVLDEPMYIADGAQLQFGAHVRLHARFRPLVVSISRDALSADYAQEMEFMYHRLGATLTHQLGPTNKLDIPKPIGMLHCVETMDNDPCCLSALAMGYSIVHPTYVVEWFAALAQNASSPLSVLPPPVLFEVPIQCHGVAAYAAFYLRPESDVCPFPLYPIPTTATLKRSRDTLFEGRKFFFLTNAVEQRYKIVVPLCGGVVHRLDDVATVAAMQQYAAAAAAAEEEEEEKEWAKKEDGNAAITHYAVVDFDMERAIRQGDSCVQAAVQQLLDNAHKAGILTTIISERSLFHSLLTNRFAAFEVACLPASNACCQNDGNKSHLHNGQNGNVDDSLHCEGAQVDMGGMLIGVAGLSITPEADASLNPGNSGKPLHSSRRPVTARRDQTQSPSKMNRREMLASERNHNTSGFTSSPVRQTHSLSVSALGSVLRHRVRAFIGKEEPKLLKVLAGAKRNMFVDSEDAEYALECRSQAIHHMDAAERLLMENSSDPRLTEDLHRCQEDCREMLRQAQNIIDCAEYTARRSHSWNRPPRISAGSLQVRRYMSSVGSLRLYHSVPVEVDHDDGDRASLSMTRATRHEQRVLQPRTPRQGGVLLPSTPRLRHTTGVTKGYSSERRDKATPRRNSRDGNVANFALQIPDKRASIGRDITSHSTPASPPPILLTQGALNINSPATVRTRGTPVRQAGNEALCGTPLRGNSGRVFQGKRACEGSSGDGGRSSRVVTEAVVTQELARSCRQTIIPQRRKTPQTPKRSSPMHHQPLQQAGTPPSRCNPCSAASHRLSPVPILTSSLRQRVLFSERH